MTSRERMLAALTLQKPDILPVTTHHVMPYYLKKYQGGISVPEFFDRFGFDAINWHVSQLPDTSKGEWVDDTQGERGFLESVRIVSDDWKIEARDVPDQKYPTTSYRIVTPQKTLTMKMQSNDYTSWIIEHPVKQREDIEVLAKYLPYPLCDREGSQKALTEIGSRGILRTHVPATIDMFGQPGCWQDACCLVGTEKLIMDTFDDPIWVHDLLNIIQKRKLSYLNSMEGSAYDLVELGGGDGCTSVISPAIFEEFVAPYDKTLIDAAHKRNQRITYHLCGSKMALIDGIAQMGMDALETLTPIAMGGDADLSKIKSKLGDKMCLIGGFDQNNYFVGCDPDTTRDAVKRCFEQAGEGGGYIISPSDHFFDAEDKLLSAFVGQAHQCKYE